MTLVQLMAEEFDIFCRKRWLREIEKATNRRNKYAELYSKEDCIIRALEKRYNEIYPKEK